MKGTLANLLFAADLNAGKTLAIVSVAADAVRRQILH